MKKRPSSLKELQLEVQRLKEEQQLKERAITHHIKTAAQSLKPVNLIKNAFSSMGSDTELKSMVKSKGVDAAIAFVVTQLLFKNSNPLVRAAVSVAGTSLASGIAGIDTTKYLERIKRIVTKLRHKTAESPDKGMFNEEDIYRS